MFDAQGMTATDGGTDHVFTFMQLDTSTFTAQKYYQIGEPGSISFVGASKMLIYNDQYLVVGGTVMDTTLDSDKPLGGIFYFDKSDISTVLAESQQTRQHETAISWRCKAYDLAISEDADQLVALVGAAVGYNSNTEVHYGRQGDSHHNVFYVYDLDETTLSPNLVHHATWNDAYMDVCDTLDIIGDFFYVSCGYWEVKALDGVLPMVVKF